MSKNILITGASRGIGRACASLFAKNGYNVIVNYFKNYDAAKTICDEINQYSNAICVRADVSNRQDVKDMVKKAHDTFGKIDVLVNNAAIAQQKMFCDITQDDWNNMINVNLSGIYNCSQEILADMVSKKSGKIINISSVWGICGASCEVHYSASKAAIIGFTKALAKELAPSNITVNCVAPGVIDTDMNSNLDIQEKSELQQEIPLGRFGTCDDIANSVLFLASDKADYITGQIISPNGGFLI